MHQYSRSDRVAQLIKEEISKIIRNELKDPRIDGISSVTKVDVSKDLRHATIYISLLGKENDQKSFFEGLEKAKGFIRSKIGNRIRLRHTPELNFKPDDSIEHGVRISTLLKQIKEGDEKGNNE